jgi:hypothetical protein
MLDYLYITDPSTHAHWDWQTELSTFVRSSSITNQSSPSSSTSSHSTPLYVRALHAAFPDWTPVEPVSAGVSLENVVGVWKGLVGGSGSRRGAGSSSDGSGSISGSGIATVRKSSDVPSAGGASSVRRIGSGSFRGTFFIFKFGFFLKSRLRTHVWWEAK